MRNGKLPLETIGIYDSKMLASRAELALLRISRTRQFDEQDKKAFARLVAFLDSAYEGDSSVSGSRLAASSEQSLEALSETLKALTDILPQAQTFKDRLLKLREGAIELSQGRIPSKRILNQLIDFVHRYGLVQSDMLKQNSSNNVTETSIWPLFVRLGYSSMF
jgi:hypothetical protein